MIIVIDYDMGNVGSVLNMFKKIGADARLSHSPDDLEGADRLVLPGVGSFDEGMVNLEHLGYLPELKRCVLEEQKPILGICLGMQLFMRGSQEGNLPGLGWIDAENVRFRFSAGEETLKTPHMGWNVVYPRKDSWIFGERDAEQRFYFVHSYHAVCDEPRDVLATTRYGYDFASVVLKGNIVGTQFHPEKSHRFGMEFLRRFAAWNGQDSVLENENNP